jgi:hypothetical protein
MRRASRTRVSRIGLATFGLLVVVSVVTTALVVRSAREVAGGKPYCIQVADSPSEYRPARMLFDLSGLAMRARSYDQHHAVLVVGDEAHPRLFHWSYRRVGFVPGVLNEMNPGHEPVIACEPQRDFVDAMPMLWPRRSGSTYVRISKNEVYRVPTSYQPRWGGGSSRFLAIATVAPDFAPLAANWSTLSEAERVRSTAFIGWNPAVVVDMMKTVAPRLVATGFGLQEASLGSLRRYVAEGQPDGGNATVIDCHPGSDAHPGVCQHRFLNKGREFYFSHRPEHLPDWRTMQARLVQLFGSFEASD